MKNKATWILGTCLALAPLAMASEARADWLVTRDGGRFEIKGPWRMKGKLVVFTLPNGSLSSLRQEQVDLDQSRTATEEAKVAAQAAADAPPEAAEKPRRKSVLSLTDKDFKKVPPPDADKEKDGKDKDGKDAKAAPASTGTVQVTNWERVPPEKAKTDGLELNGTVTNPGNQQVTDIQVLANLYDDVGTLVGKVSAQLTNPSLGPGESTTFTVTAPGLYSFSAVKFETQGRGFKAKTPPPAAADSSTAPPPH